jgi:eukaryotic-like serine/threonine-protein kinase
MPETLIAGRYRLDELLGRGGMSEVWCATDTELGRRVAIKLLAPEADTARFEREAKAVASLASPNIMQLYDYGEEGDRPYMVLEYLSGGTLEDRLREHDGPLPDDETASIAAQVAAGLAHAHSRGVVHRDLKPANLIVRCDGSLVLTDFGIAARTGDAGASAAAGTLTGTAAYAAPEQLQGDAPAPAADVYSLGVIFHELLCGRTPFAGKTPLELIAQQLVAPVPRLPSPLARFQPLLDRLLDKRPQHRPRDGAAVFHHIQALAPAVAAAG